MVIPLSLTKGKNSTHLFSQIQQKFWINFQRISNLKIWKNLKIHKINFQTTKLGNTLLTRIRVGRSDLKQHKFTIGLIDSPECICHFKSESAEHYFLDCFIYSPERQILFRLIEHYVPFFKNLSKKKKLELILNGVNKNDDIFLPTNTTIMKATQHFIISTKRFTNKE